MAQAQGKATTVAARLSAGGASAFFAARISLLSCRDGISQPALGGRNLSVARSLTLAMSSADEHLKLAAECAALASAAQWPETRKVWLQVEALYRTVAEHEARMAAGVPALLGRPS